MIRLKVEAELDRLQSEGIIERVLLSEWAHSHGYETRQLNKHLWRRLQNMAVGDGPVGQVLAGPSLLTLINYYYY